MPRSRGSGPRSYRGDGPLGEAADASSEQMGHPLSDPAGRDQADLPGWLDGWFSRQSARQNVKRPNAANLVFIIPPWWQLGAPDAPILLPGLPLKPLSQWKAVSYARH